MENITRRNCLKLFCSLSGIILLNNLTGCKEIPEEKEENGRIYHDENGTENLFWKPTGNSKDFNPGEHFIYTIVSIQYKNNGQINIPEGYEYVSSETITSMSGPGSTTYQIKYNFINVVPVTALEYKHTETKEIAYPYSGTVIELENENTSSYQKTLS